MFIIFLSMFGCGDNDHSISNNNIPSTCRALKGYYGHQIDCIFEKRVLHLEGDNIDDCSEKDIKLTQLDNGILADCDGRILGLAPVKWDHISTIVTISQ